VGLSLLAGAGKANAAPQYTLDPTLTRIAGAETRCYHAWPAIWADANGWYDETGPTIGLPPWACRTIARSLSGEGRPARVGMAWFVFSHEVAHHLGFEHEGSPSTDAVGWRRLGLLMARGGVPVELRQAARRALLGWYE
jgi:hypothetical protein